MNEQIGDLGIDDIADQVVDVVAEIVEGTGGIDVTDSGLRGGHVLQSPNHVLGAVPGHVTSPVQGRAREEAPPAGPTIGFR